MKVIEPYTEILTKVDGENILREIELFARNCYKSEGKTTPDSAKPFVKKLMHTLKHRGIADHHMISVRWVCDRGVSHELVRHRIAAYLQESTRYCNYSGEMVFIRPPWVTPIASVSEYFLQSDDNLGAYPEIPRLPKPDEDWYWTLATLSSEYNKLLKAGWKPEQARSILPNALKTEVISSLNLTSWRNLFTQRTAPNAHPQIRQLAIPLLAEFKKLVPVIFDDIEPGPMPWDITMQENAQ